MTKNTGFPGMFLSAKVGIVKNPTGTTDDFSTLLEDLGGPMNVKFEQLERKSETIAGVPRYTPDLLKRASGRSIQQ